MISNLAGSRETITREALTPGQVAWRRFRRHRMAVVGAGLLVALILYVTLGALVFTEAAANYVDLRAKLSPPTWAHPFGTDLAGRDILARTVYGGQISILIGLTAVLISAVVGVLIGALAGYFGGLVDNLLMRFTEAVFNIPQLFLLIVLAKFFATTTASVDLFGRAFNGNVVVIVSVIGLTSWMYLARITVTITLEVANAILSEAYVSFLGMGVQPPTATWGNMLNEAYTQFESAPWMWFFPGMLIVGIVLAINFVGDGLRDAFDPRSLAQRAE